MTKDEPTQTQNTSKDWTALSNELWISILSYLSVEELINVKLTNKEFYKRAMDTVFMSKESLDSIPQSLPKKRRPRKTVPKYITSLHEKSLGSNSKRRLSPQKENTRKSQKIEDTVDEFFSKLQEDEETYIPIWENIKILRKKEENKLKKECKENFAWIPQFNTLSEL